MIVIYCLETKAYHAIYKEFNESRVYQLMISAYAFNVQGCKYPDQTETATSLNVNSMRVAVRPRTNPILISYHKPTYNQGEKETHRESRGRFPL